MTTFLYTHYYAADSSAIQGVFYDKITGRLIVVTHNGVYAGYEGVAPETFHEFTTSNSMGQYWNRYIKPQFEGFSTADISGFRKREDEVLVPAAGVDYGSTPEVSEDPHLPQNFIVSVRGIDYNFELNVQAVDLSEAAAKANEIAKIAGWQNHVIYSVALSA